MARFEGPKGRMNKSRSRGGSPRRGSKGGDFRESSRGRRESKREFEMTKTTCSACKKECEVPFKPTSNKPIYCDKCFAKKDRGNQNTNSDKDFDIINEKLNKIMRALDIK